MKKFILFLALFSITANASSIKTSSPVVVPGTSNGVVSASGLPGSTTGSAIAAGFVGEIIASSFSNYTATTSTADVTGATLPLTAGTWRIFMEVEADLTSGTGVGAAATIQVLMTNSSNVQVGNFIASLFISTTAASSQIQAPIVYETVLSISSSTTYKLRALLSNNSGTGATCTLFSTTNASSASVFYAVRIA